jgi:hypothetical protein
MRYRSTSCTITANATIRAWAPAAHALQHAVRPVNNNAPIERRERLGGVLNFYYRRAA